MVMRKALLALLLLASPLQAQIKLSEVKRLPIPQDAVGLAHQDMQLLLKNGFGAQLPFIRYLWVPPRKNAEIIDDARAASGGMHYISRSHKVGRESRPTPLVGGAVLRVDLRKYVRLRNFLVGDLGDWLKTWEFLQFDPYFATFITADMVKLETFADQDVPKVKTHKSNWVLKDVPRFQQEGQWYTQKWVEEKIVTEVPITQAKDFVALRLAGIHLDQMQYGALQELLQTQAPILHIGNVITRTLASIEDDGLKKLMYGGLYYEFAGIKKADKGKNDELELYKQLGVNTGNQTLDEFFDALESDRRAAMTFSRITSRSRQLTWFPSLADVGGIVFVTRDTKEREIDILKHAVANLLVFKHDASEIIFQKSNGFHGFALTDGKGNLVRFADPEVVYDAEIPRPFRNHLQPAIGCIRCHRYEDGLRPFSNVVTKLVPLADTGNLNKNTLETFDRLQQLYKSSQRQINDLLLITRNRYNTAVLEATGPWKRSKDQTDLVRLLGEQLTGIEEEYRYNLVTPEVACRELGFEPPEGKALDLLQQLLPADGGNKYLVQALGFVPEDFRLAILLAGEPITRYDWHLSYSYAAARANRVYQEALAREKKK